MWGEWWSGHRDAFFCIRFLSFRFVSLFVAYRLPLSPCHCMCILSTVIIPCQVDHDSTLGTMQALISLYQRAKRPRLAVKAEAIFQEYFDLMVRKYGHEDTKAAQGRAWLEQVQVRM